MRLSRTRWIGPITSFLLLDRFGAAADVPADLPALTKKAGCKAMLNAPSADGIKREVDATETIRAGRGALSPTPVRVDEIVHAVDAPHRLVHAARAELERVVEAVKHVGGSALRAV
jgi:hypothetical protein